MIHAAAGCRVSEFEPCSMRVQSVECVSSAKTGRTLIRPLCYSRDADRMVIIGSYGGAPHNPPWYYNLLANPVVTVEVGVEKFKARAALRPLVWNAKSIRRASPLDAAL